MYREARTFHSILKNQNAKDERGGFKVHKKDLYKFIESQPSGLDLISSGASPLALDILLFMTDPCLARFLDEDAVEGALRLTPEVGVDLPLVAGDIEV